MSDFLTRREKILEILRSSNRPLTVVEIAERLGIRDTRSLKEIYEDLKHVGKTLYRETSGRETLVMIPSRCLRCGYVFKERTKIKRPSKCPKCKSERVSEPSFMIIRR